MAVGTGYSKVASSGLVFAYDTGDTYNSYIGEPTTNLETNNPVTFDGYGWSWTTTTVGYYYGRYCMRCHVYSPGNNPNWTGAYQGISAVGNPGDIFTRSCEILIEPGGSFAWTPNVNATHGGANGENDYYDLSRPGTWQKLQATVTNTSTSVPFYFYWFARGAYDPTNVDFVLYFYHPQLEKKDHATQFTPSSRSTTQGLLDISGRSNIITLNNSYDANAQFFFDGSDDYLDLNPNSIPSGNELTVEFVCAWNGGLQPNSIIAGGSGGNQDLSLHLPWNDGNVYWDAGRPFNRIYKYAQPSEYLGNHHWVCTKNANTGEMAIYLDGNLWHSGGGLTSPIPDLAEVNIGRYNNGSTRAYYYKGNIYVAKTYNRALSLSEVRGNYFHYKTRFGLP